MMCTELLIAFILAISVTHAPWSYVDIHNATCEFDGDTCDWRNGNGSIAWVPDNYSSQYGQRTFIRARMQGESINSTAVLESPWLCATQNHVPQLDLIIRYNNRCPDQACRLSVSTQSDGQRTLWNTTLSTPDWRNKTLAIPPSHDIKIFVEASSVQWVASGEIQIDSITIIPVTCKGTTSLRPHMFTPTQHVSNPTHVPISTFASHATLQRATVDPTADGTEKGISVTQREADDSDSSVAVGIGVTLAILLVGAGVAVFIFFIRRRNWGHGWTKRLQLPECLRRKLQTMTRGYSGSATEEQRSGVANATYNDEIDAATINLHAKTRANNYKNVSRMKIGDDSTPADVVDTTKALSKATIKSTVGPDYSVAVIESQDNYASPDPEFPHAADIEEDISDHYSSPDDPDTRKISAAVQKECRNGYELAAITTTEYSTPHAKTPKTTPAKYQNGVTASKGNTGAGEYNRIQHNNLSAVPPESGKADAYTHLSEQRFQADQNDVTQNGYSLTKLDANALHADVTHPNYVNVTLNTDTPAQPCDADYSRLNFGFDLTADFNGATEAEEGEQAVYNHLQMSEDEYRRLYFDSRKFEPHVEGDEYSHIAGDGTV